MFAFGKTKVKASVTGVQHLDGVTSMIVKAKPTGLEPNTVYYYRVLATSTDGRDTGAFESFTTTGKPVISALRLTPRPLKTSGTITYKDSIRATTTFAVLRCGHRVGSGCERYRRVRRFKHTDVAGRNRARLNARGLAQGSYKLEATPRAGKLRGKTVAVTFTVRQ